MNLSSEVYRRSRAEVIPAWLLLVTVHPLYFSIKTNVYFYSKMENLFIDSNKGFYLNYGFYDK
ncbi:hypothetical protein JCM10914A_27560 [Paenibacillus sp. JCM 10914]